MSSSTLKKYLDQNPASLTGILAAVIVSLAVDDPQIGLLCGATIGSCTYNLFRSALRLSRETRRPSRI